MMARKWRIEELSVVADPWNLKLKPAKLTTLRPLSLSRLQRSLEKKVDSEIRTYLRECGYLGEESR